MNTADSAFSDRSLQNYTVGAKEHKDSCHEHGAIIYTPGMNIAIQMLDEVVVKGSQLTGQELAGRVKGGDEAFSMWFYRAVTNKAMDYHRKTSRRREQPGDEYPLRSVNPWEAMDAELIVKGALRELPEKYREVLILKFSEV